MVVDNILRDWANEGLLERYSALTVIETIYINGDIGFDSEDFPFDHLGKLLVRAAEELRATEDPELKLKLATSLGAAIIKMGGKHAITFYQGKSE